MNPQPPTTQPPPSEPQPNAVMTVLPERPPAQSGGMARVTVESLAALPDSEKKMAWIATLMDAEVARQTFAQDRALAREFAASGKFDDLKGQTNDQAIATAMVKIQMGRSWGFNAADSIRYIYFVNGKPALEQEIVASTLQKYGYSWDVEWLEETQQHKGKPWQRCIGCRLWLKKVVKGRMEPLLDRNGQQVSVSFTEADADHAEVYDHGKTVKLSDKATYKSWGRDMYYWRCISRVKKYHAPHVLRGGVLREEALEIFPEDLTPEFRPADLGPAELQPPAELEPPLMRPAEAGPNRLADELAAANRRDREGEQEGLFQANPLP